MDFKPANIGGRKRFSLLSLIFSISFLLQLTACLLIFSSEAFSSEGIVRAGEGTSRLVSPDRQNGYSRIQSALDAAEPGDVVVLEKGVYLENLVIEKSVEIRSESGDGRDAAIVAADQEFTVLRASCKDGHPATIKVSGVSLHGGDGFAPALLCDSSAIFELENVSIGGPSPEIDPVSISLEISIPSEGEQFETDTIAVSGTVSRPGATVLVNGAAAAVVGRDFSAADVGLVPGSNAIEVLVEEGDDIAVAVVNVEFLDAVDLEPVLLETLFYPEADESLKVAGQANVTIANRGRGGVVAPWRVVLFEDIDADGVFDETADNLLGEKMVVAGPGGGEAIDVAIEFAGVLLFRDSPIHVFADWEDVVVESDEGNNVAAFRTVGVDLSASLLRIEGSGCSDGATITVRIGNAGDAIVPSGVPVAFYDGEPGKGGELLGTTETSRALEPGWYENLSFLWNEAFAEAESVYVTADDDGSGEGILSEADEENNRVSSEIACNTLAFPTNGIHGKIVDAETGTFLAGADVVLHESENGVPGTVVAQTVSDGGGGFVFPETEPGTYFLVASLPEYIEVKSQVELATGDSSARRDIVLSPLLSNEEIRVVLTWGEHPLDLEAHLTAPNPGGCRHHCFYWNRTIPGASLDVDDMDFFGSETITISEKTTGTYRFYVHDFTNRNSATSEALSGSDAEVTVYFGTGDPPQVFRVPDGIGTVWHVFNLDGDDGTIVPVGKITRQGHPGRIDFPEITSSPSTGAVCGTRYFYQVEAEDPDLDVLSFGLDSGPDGMILNPSTGLLEWTPESDQGGRHDVKVRVSDGRCGEDYQVFPINVTYMPAVEFSVEPSSGMNPGGEITLTWKTERADTVVIDRGVGPVPAKGSMNVPSPEEPITFTITAANEAGQAKTTVPGLPRIPWFTTACVEPEGGSATLNWTSDGAFECRIEPEIGSVGIEGPMTVAPLVLPANYTLVCANGAGEYSKKATVDYCVPRAYLSASVDCGWTPGYPVVLNWTAGGTDDCSILPSLGPVPLAGHAEVTPIEEPATYSLSCAGASDTVVIENPQSMSLWASSYALLPGESTDLVWNTTCFDTCTFDHGIGDVPCSGVLTVTPEQLPVAYTLTSVNDLGSHTRFVTVDYSRPSVSFAASPATIKKGEQATLTWSSAGAESCSIEPDIGQVSPNGSIDVAPDQNTEFVLAATGPGGTTKKTATVTYVKPAASIHANPELLDHVGQSSILTWVFSNADTCFVDQGIGEVQLGESIEVTPTRTTTYTITAIGPGGVAKDYATVAFVPPLLEFSAEPGVLDEGDTATLSWAVENADTRAIDQGIGEVQPAGSLVVDPVQTTTYTFTAEGPGGRVSDSVTVTCLAPVVEIAIEPETIVEGQSAVLTWRAEHAATWVVGPAVGEVESEGSTQVRPLATTTYTVTASGRGGTASAQVELVVINPPSIVLVEPDGEEDFANTGFPIQWTDRDPDSDATISLYYDINDTGANGVLIETGIGETPDGSEDLYVWDTTEIPDGTYYVYAVIDDGVNPPFVDYGGAVIVDHSVGDIIKLLASDGQAFDYFGGAVSIDGDYAVAGAHGTDEGGAVYVFERQGASWIERAKLLPDDEVGVRFGDCVAISGDTLVVGDPHGNGYKGTVYVFTRDGSTWTRQARLTVPDGAEWDRFGECVSIDGDTLVAGAPGADDGSGASFVFERLGTSWGNPTKLTGNENSNQVNFGASVSIDGDRLIVGAPLVADATGAAFVFRLVESAWVLEAMPVPADAPESAKFGSSVSMSGNSVIVGNTGLSEAAVEGTVYVFIFDGTTWKQQVKVESTALEAGDSFGNTVSLHGDTAAVGEPNVWNETGAVYLFERTGSLWPVQDPSNPEEHEGDGEEGMEGEGEVQTEEPSASSGFVKLIPSEGQAVEYFGESLDLDGEHVIVGAPCDDDKGDCSGSVYIYPLFFVRISAEPRYAVIGEEEATATLSWTSRGAEEVRIDPGIGEVSGTGSLLVYLRETTTYTITATRDGATKTDTVAISVIDSSNSPSIAISATPECVVRGEPATLSWSSTNVDTVVLYNGIGEVPPNGSLVVHPIETTIYVATASNEGGSAAANVEIAVADPPPAVSLSAAPSEIEQGESATLSWTSENVETLTIEPEIGPVEPNGNRTISPMETTTYTIMASGPGGENSSVVTVSVHLPSPISVQIASPVDGSSVSGMTVSVKGTVSHENDLETAVVVNGILAIVGDGKFFADNVPLVQGENVVTVAATDAAGGTKIESVTVDADTSGMHIGITAEPLWGGPPFETTLRIAATFDIALSQMSHVGPDAVDFLENGIEEYRIGINAIGTYTFMVEAIDHLGNSYQGEATVEAIDETVLDALLRSKWAGMKVALIAGNIPAALEFHQEDTRERYGAIYNALGDALPSLVGNMRDISAIFFEGTRAKYRILQEHDIEGQTIEITYYIYFSRDVNGIWKIDKY